MADSNSEQKKIVNELRCETEEIVKILKDIVKMLSESNLDLKNLHDSVGLSLENLGGRFSRDFNVDVELSEWLNIFCNTDINRENIFKDINELRSAIENNRLVDNEILLQHICLEIDKIRRNQEFSYDFLKHEIRKFIVDTEEALNRKYKDNESDYYRSNEYYYWRRLCSINDHFDTYRKGMLADIFIITGEAGVGKSHSIAQFINNAYFLRGKPCIFLLGQHLNENVDPIIMIEKSLHLPYTLQSFLEELNLYALSQNVEIPFVIEGINEGLYSEIWKEYFWGLTETFGRFKKIKLIVSIRKTYIKKCFPEGYEKKDNLLIVEHKGFANNPIEAVLHFFEYYGISMPTFPILYADFYNPLFLHTLCRTIQVSGGVSIEEYGSFTEVFINYIKVIEAVIAQRCNYRENLRLVQKVVNEIIKYSLDNDLRYGIEIDVFYKIVRDVVSVFGICLTDFVQAMIDNGLFYTEMYGYEEEREYIQFAYERYHNILAAQYILKNVDTLEELKESILQGGINNCFAKYQNGIIEELFVQIPQKYKVEFLELLPEEQAIEVLDLFLNSLVWRKGVDIETKKAKDLINKYIICREWYFEEMLKKFFITAPIGEHPFNALALHDYLSKFSMADRDAFWVKIITDELRYDSVLTTLIKLGQDQKELYSEETRKLIMLLLGWTLACTTNDYREEAIRTMVSLMENELCSATYLVEKFSNVNDGYIKEGIYSAIYGAVLRSSNLIYSEELGDTIYDDIFDNGEVYPHVIVRAHAKGILDYLSYKGVRIKKDLSKIIPPYNSEWYEEIPTDEEIKAYKFDYRKGKISREMYGVNHIIDSMATNTGEKASMYGDFGRYIFEGWVEPWEYYFIPQELSNVVVKIIMEQYGYDYQKHGDFDAQVNYHDRHDHSCERIGKKYQRIASFEMLAKLADNFEPGTVETIYSKTYSERRQKEFDFFLKSLTEDVSKNDEWLEFDYEEDEEDGDEDVKTVFNSYKYEGPWQFEYRGIDPTVLTKKVKKEKNFWGKIWNIPQTGINAWACATSSEPNIEDILIVKYGDEDFVVVEMYNTWKSKEEILGEEPEEYFLKALAAFVPQTWTFDANEKNIARNFAEGRNYAESYIVFGREFYWSDAYKYFEKLYQEEREEEKKQGIKFIATGIDYHCPTSYSEKAENIVSSYSVPSEYIVDKLKLEQLEDGKWFDPSGKLVAVNITVDGYHAALLINRTAILQIMKSSNMKLVWGIYTEKKEKNLYYETRKAVQWDGQKFEIQQYQEEQWESARW